MYEGAIDSKKDPISNQDKEKIDTAIRIFAERSPPLTSKTSSKGDQRIDVKQSMRRTPVEVYSDFLKSIPREYTTPGYLKQYYGRILKYKQEKFATEGRSRPPKENHKYYHHFLVHQRSFLEKSILTQRRDYYVKVLRQLLKTKSPFTVVGVLKYDVYRGRSSIIFACPDGAYRVITRGRVANMENRFEPGTKPELIRKEIERLEALNLIPMLYGLKKISARELNEHYEDYMKARNNSTKREETISEEYSRLERNMVFTWADGIQPQQPLPPAEPLPQFTYAPSPLQPLPPTTPLRTITPPSKPITPTLPPSKPITEINAFSEYFEQVERLGRSYAKCMFCSGTHISWVENGMGRHLRVCRGEVSEEAKEAASREKYTVTKPPSLPLLLTTPTPPTPTTSTPPTSTTPTSTPTPPTPPMRFCHSSSGEKDGEREIGMRNVFFVQKIRSNGRKSGWNLIYEIAKEKVATRQEQPRVLRNQRRREKSHTPPPSLPIRDME